MKIYRIQYRIGPFYKHYNSLFGHFEKIQYGRHQGSAPLGTPSEIDQYIKIYLYAKFGTFITKIT